MFTAAKLFSVTRSGVGDAPELEATSLRETSLSCVTMSSVALQSLHLRLFDRSRFALHCLSLYTTAPHRFTISLWFA